MSVHGYRRAYRIAGGGPAVVLLHGIGDSSGNWLDTIDELARDYLVIAPDLLGHGDSDKPRADYSIAAYANGVRDLLCVLGVERATLIGHSLGGGVAIQFAYQFPERVERLVLVSVGGGGPEVTPLFRLLSTPLAPPALLSLRLPFARLQLRMTLAGLAATSCDLGLDARELLRLMDGLATRDGRAAFLRTLRAVVDWRGQVVTMLDRCYLLADIPALIIWGDRDAIIPVSHARRVQTALPGSRLEIFRGAGHLPHRSDPARFLALVRDFLASTSTANWDAQARREALLAGRPSSTRATTGDLDPYADRSDPVKAASERSAT